MARIVAKPHLIFFFISNFFLLLLISFIIILAAIFLFAFIHSIDWVVFLFFFGMAVISGIASWVYSYLYYLNTSLIVDEEKVIYEYGILHHSVNTIPLKNITDFSLKRSFIQRLFNIATLSINTAGGQGFEINALDFNYPEVFRISSLLNSKIHRH